ncbi:MAG: hypothetical protein RR250_07760, partial [Akkermansia sp.]
APQASTATSAIATTSKTTFLVVGWGLMLDGEFVGEIILIIWFCVRFTACFLPANLTQNR